MTETRVARPGQPNLSLKPDSSLVALIAAVIESRFWRRGEALQTAGALETSRRLREIQESSGADSRMLCMSRRGKEAVFMRCKVINFAEISRFAFSKRQI